MSQLPEYTPYRSRTNPLPYAQSETGIIASFMNGVYAWMCVGLLVTAIVAWVTAHSDAMRALFYTRGTFLVLFLAELGLVWVISAAINRLSAATATGLFVLYAALNGLTLSVIFLVYAPGTITSAFTITAGMFGATSLFGFVTKKDLSGIGGLCFMALFGIILASIANFFMASPALYWAITYLGVAIFVGLTAYDTQKLKGIALQTQDNPALASRLAIVGSLALYLDFINLLLFILRILGNKGRK
jgi:uncharacterized protein